MPRARALLAESIHTSANPAFEATDIAVHRVSAGLSPQELIAALAALPGDEPVMIGIRSKTKVRSEVLDASPRLAAIGAFCIGTDQIDLDAARAKGIAVFNAPFSNTRSVAELVIAEVVMLSRQIFPRSMAAHRGVWQKSATGSHEVRGKTLGIVGYGHIGSQLSVLAESLGLKVIYHDIVNKLPLGNASAASSLAQLLSASDFVSLHVPNTEITRGMFGAEQLAQMKPGAHLINASRGTVVDLEALRESLQSGHVAGAAIDVYPKEPAAKGDAFQNTLRGLDQVILTPHIGGSTQEAQANIGVEVSEALSTYMTAGRTTGCVTLPQVEAPAILPGICRLINLHRNVPGVLSAVNEAVAAAEVNIVRQQLATREEVGLLVMDMAAASADVEALKLGRRIARLETSLRTRLLG